MSDSSEDRREYQPPNSSLKRRTPLTPNQPDHATAHNSHLRPYNPERQKRREEKGEVYGPYHRWVKTTGCVGKNHPRHACGFFPDRKEIEGHHLMRVGAGGKDFANEVGACPKLHDMCHGKYGSYTESRVEEKLGFSLKVKAAELSLEYPGDDWENEDD